jgi:tetratricopeptide (TPR) repeat protein
MYLVDELKKEIADRHAILIVGAGVAIAATDNHPCASWTGLLHHGAGRCADLRPELQAKWLARVNEEIDSEDLDDMLSAAEKITSKLGAPGEFSRWLRESVGAITLKRPDVLEALSKLDAPIATTNYDGLIEQVTGLAPVTWQEGAKVERVLRGDDKGVLHLHGYWEQPESVVLGIRSYEKTLGDAHAQTVLRALAMMKTLVFVGCGAGLRDPNFGRFLAWTGSVFSRSEYRRYRLAREADREKLQSEHPPEQRLYVVSFGERHEDLTPFLRSLAPAARPMAPAAPKTSPALPGKPRCFGREVELAALVSNLLAPNPQPTPILGPPGIGKSTLSVAALYDAEVAARYGARRWFIRCDGITSRIALAAAIAQAAGLSPSPTIEDAALSELAAAPSALVLDNAETPWEADALETEQLLGRLASIPALALIISIRGAERPAGADWLEACRPQPLSLPAARQVFLSIAGKKYEADARLDPLIEAVDRVPLAVTLMAHAAEAEPDLEGPWQRWQDGRTNVLRRLGGADRLSNIELSYEISRSSKRMTADARRLLGILALLPGGVDAKDLPSVMPTGGGVAASVLRKTGLAFDEGGRLRILAPLREYIKRSHKPNSADADQAAMFYVKLAIDHGDQVGGKDGAASVQRLAPEAANIEEMILQTLASGAAPEAVRAARCFAEFVRFTGFASTNAIASAADGARAQGDVLGEAGCILSLGQIALDRSDHEGAKKEYEQAISLYRQVGDVRGENNCILSLGENALRRSDHETARQRYEEALLRYRQAGDVLGEANCIQRLGDIAVERPDHEAALQRYEEALPLFRQEGDVVGEANCIYGLGDIALARQDHETARQQYDKALPLYRQVGSVLGEANCIQGMGDIALARSDHKTARQRYEEALRLYLSISDKHSMGAAFQRLARLAQDSPTRIGHARSARASWLSIDRPDLVRKVDDEFGPLSD